MGTQADRQDDAASRREPDAGTVQAQRVESLLATVHDLVSSLRHVSSQLDREVSAAIAAPVRDDLVQALRAENAQLREAVESRAVIEQAKGMLIARYGCDADRAFAMLGELSRTERRKVRDVAAAMVRAAMRSPNARVVDLASGKSSNAPSATG